MLGATNLFSHQQTSTSNFFIHIRFEGNDIHFTIHSQTLKPDLTRIIDSSSVEKASNSIFTIHSQTNLQIWPQQLKYMTCRKDSSDCVMFLSPTLTFDRRKTPKNGRRSEVKAFFPWRKELIRRDLSL
ncbi:unnamed protein product [Lactuca saligna]|uniref:Uncharacterized protein n=1 Tax=Lactuca saligna TaxID=75948 RepID=A0AA35YK60_LACSI|nr:unnamed protein product [Lactuca saligna]